MEHACCAQAHRKVIAARFVFVDARNRNDGKLGNTFFLVFFFFVWLFILLQLTYKESVPLFAPCGTEY